MIKIQELLYERGLIFNNGFVILKLFGGAGILRIMTKKLLIANWKMNPASLQEAEQLCQGYAGAAPLFKNVEVVVAAPFVYLDRLSKVFRAMDYALEISLGAQDMFWESAGAYTGQISPAMLKDMGVQYVIIGHSERRHMGETNVIVNKKVRAAGEVGLKVVLCVGEESREKGFEEAKAYIEQQLAHALEGIDGRHGDIIIAYEPVWAIGTGTPDTPEDAVQMIDFINELLLTRYQFPLPRILYGGSVNAENAHGFLSREEIDGALVGGASLNAEAFAKIAGLVNN